MSRDRYDDAHYMCFCGTAHVISKLLAAFLFLVCILLTGFGFCSTSNTLVVIAGTIGCFSTLLLLLLLTGVLFDKSALLLPFLVVFGVYMSITILLFIIYILIGTATDLIDYFYDDSEWLKRLYFDLNIDIKDSKVRRISCVILLVISIFHSILVTFIWTVFFLAHSYILKTKREARIENGSSLSVEHSPTTPLSNRVCNHNLFYADSSFSDLNK